MCSELILEAIARPSNQGRQTMQGIHVTDINAGECARWRKRVYELGYHFVCSFRLRRVTET
jgi:hypothetical protein